MMILRTMPDFRPPIFEMVDLWLRPSEAALTVVVLLLCLATWIKKARTPKVVDADDGVDA